MAALARIGTKGFWFFDGTGRMFQCMTLNTTWPIQESKSDFFMTARVLLVADHSVMQEGLRVLLGREDDIKVVGVAGDGRTAVEMAPDHFEKTKSSISEGQYQTFAHRLAPGWLLSSWAKGIPDYSGTVGRGVPAGTSGFHGRLNQGACNPSGQVMHPGT